MSVDEYIDQTIKGIRDYKSNKLFIKDNSIILFITNLFGQPKKYENTE